MAQKIHLLLVEDSRTHVELMRDSLGPLGSRVTLSIATSLAEARSFLNSTTPDLAIVDLLLPDGRGTDLLANIGQEAPFPSIILTSHGDEQVAVEALKAGALDYVVKTADALAELPRIVERSLREWRLIEERKEAQDALRQSEKKYRSLFENMGEAVAVDEIILDDEGWAIDWTVLDVNPAYEGILGISRQEAVGRRASELYGPEFDLQKVLDVYSKMSQSREPTQTEVYFPPNQKYLLVSYFLLEDGLFATLSKDITERKRAEAERERLLAERDATINAIADAVVIFKPDGRIAQMNPAAQRMLGYTEDDLGKTLSERTSKLQVETAAGRPFDLEQTMAKVFVGETMQGVIAVLRRSDGTTTWLSNSAAPIRTSDGQLVGAVGTATDITTVHELQEQRDLYLHTISHDLRIPLTVIQGYAQIIEQTSHECPQADTVMPSIQGILDGTRRMALMIEDLVDTARLEGGSLELDKQPLSPESFLRDLVVRSERALDVNRLSLDLPQDLPTIMADAARLERVVMNLLTNAFKYSSENSPVQLRARIRENAVLVSVTDKGKGIAQEDLPYIFDRFYRVKSEARKDRVGLGLYISKMLVEAHGGQIWADSLPGRGSTFSFTLPLP